MARYQSRRVWPGIAPVLRQAREQAGKTQKEAAQAASVDVDTLASWEAGRTDPRCTQVLELALFYGIAPSQLFKDLEFPREAEPCV